MLQRRNTAGEGRNVARSNVVAMDPKSRSNVVAMDPKSHGRARVTNGSDLFAERVDGRSVWARRFKDLIELHVADLGGPESLSEARRGLIRRVATLEVESERLECLFAKDGGGSNRMLDRYQSMANNLRRLLITLGLDSKVS